ncbi:hypothetical protein [Streptomyces sp. NPDC098781]|uniref:hypothetical protein n=1 Tax=Streptomyces sp. NPDC098781 TaxID=3366097 RepID=UPI0038303128
MSTELRTGDTVLVTRTFPDGTVYRFKGVADFAGPEGIFTVVGHDPDTELHTTGYFMTQDSAYGVKQDVVRISP